MLCDGLTILRATVQMTVEGDEMDENEDGILRWELQYLLVIACRFCRVRLRFRHV
jgi:hypothetical protein